MASDNTGNTGKTENSETVGINNETIYSQTIKYIYPDNEVSLKNITTFFKKNGQTPDPNIMNAMEFVYGKPLTIEGLKKIDLGLKFETVKIREHVIANYKDGDNKTDNDKVYNTMKEIDPKIEKKYIDNFIKDYKLEDIDKFADYVISIIP